MKIQTASILMMAIWFLAACQPDAPKEVVSNTVVAVAQPVVASVAESAPVVAVETAPVAATPLPTKPVEPKEKTRSVVPVKTGVPVSTKAEPPQIAPVAAAVVAPMVETKPSVLAAAVSSDADALALAKKSNCMTCHAIDKKVVGPAWKDVAAKYRGDAAAEARIAAKIAKGGSGAWGAIAMPANTKLSETERVTLAKFVLNLK